MADDPNSMQMQLGLVGGTGSFNPLGIATPAPPAPPMVRHPGDVSSDIVRQTQTQMATTLQTTSAMRMGGMGGMAFGGSGMGAVGAFSQQYQQNMAGIQSQQLNPFSAQMMGVMGGFGSGLNTGMMPNPGMMTAPGMGIYRPFQQPPTPTVSPFPQQPLFPTPFTPRPPPAMFQTPMELSNNLAIQAGQMRTAAMFATPGVMARAGADLGIGAMGAGMGASLGARFGPGGALIGGGIGALAGALGSERLGLGATAQNITDTLNPFRTMAIRGQQMMGASQSWVTGGADLNMSGRGLSMTGSTHLARRLEDTAFSSGFRRETGGAFSAQDLTKITNVAGQQGLLNDTQSVDQIHDRVKTIAKSLVSFMKIANEPNVVEALKSMGRARQMGMTIGETMDMAMEARMYSKMAGQSVSGIMGGAGMQGAMMYQQQGLSAGLGMRMGMGAMGMANAAVAGGAFTPQRLAMLGGVQGVAQHEMESSAAFLKMPMLAAAMSQMGRGGEFGVSGGALSALRGGQMNIGQMATMGANNMLSAVQRQGVGALGMMQIQGTEIQDQIGRLLGPQGMQAAKMGQVMQTMGMMGLDKNPGGFATAALSMGMTNDQVKTMMSQAQSPGYWRNLQAQNQGQIMEARGLEAQARDARRPGFLGNLFSQASGSNLVSGNIGELYAGARNLGERTTNFFGLSEEDSRARRRGGTVLRTDRSLLAGSDAELREIMAETEGEGAQAESNIQALHAVMGTQSRRDRRFGGVLASEAESDEIIGNWDEQVNAARRHGGWEGAFGRVGVAAKRFRRAGKAAGWGVATAFGVDEGEADRFFGLSAAAERDQLREADDREGAAIWTEAMQYEDAGAYTKKINELGGGTTEGAAEIAGIAADLRLRMTKKARASRNWFADDKMETGSGAATLAKEAAGDKWGTMSEKERRSLIAVASQGVGADSGNEGYAAPWEIVDVSAHEGRVDRARRQLTEGTDLLFGAESKGLDLFGGTQTKRDELMDKMFGEGRTGEGGRLLALKAAADAEADVNGPAHKAYIEAQKGLARSGDKGTGALREMEALRKSLGSEGKGQLEEMGRRLSTVTTSDAEMKQAIAETRGSRKHIKAGQLEASGLGRAFDVEIGKDTQIADLLRSGTTTDPTLKKLQEDYRVAEAEDDKAAMSRIEFKAKKYARRLGTNVAAEEKGGRLAKAERGIRAVASALAGTEANVSQAFPQAVDSLKIAADTLQDAAEAMGRKFGGPDFGNDT